jgi:hypothetical protein
MVILEENAVNDGMQTEDNSISKIARQLSALE